MRHSRIPVPTLLLVLLWALAAPAGRAEAREVRVGAFVESVSAVDPADGSFGVSAYLWFIDPEGRFDPRSDLYLLARSSTISGYYEERGADGRAYVSVEVSAVVDQEYDLTDFPFDEQLLTLRIEAGDPADTIRFVPDDTAPGIADHVRLADWRVGGARLTAADHRYDVRYGLEDTGPRVYSQLELSVEVARVQTRVVVDDFLGFIFSFIITGLIYFVPSSELGTRIGMTTGSLFAALLNLNRLLDAAGFKSEFGLVEQLGFLIFGAILCSLAISIAMKRASVKWGVARADRIDAILGGTVMLGFLVAIILVLRAGMR
ncbi:hypothetical protein [Amaricoccus solimangrovi]|uniref:Neurotransmitter-gated ion-channel ligand-binding domain-containing protein n=1 Tax=Amaricoccus solimangrovi TaxID=2589815 RepID=A0A501WDB9_9RHOB|nr:hypothetical protein [Amaricoccus solimangrovi]TPE47378.1 hypothetical protein FJM51_20110 [Amaricoccus solimangrovi]